MVEGSAGLPLIDESAVLPPHVDPCRERDHDCDGRIFDVVAYSDGATRRYECIRPGCDGPDFLADLIEGAEP